MKKITPVITLAILGFFAIHAQAQTQEETLKKAFALFESGNGKDLGPMMAASSQFDLAANKWSNEYAANYYAAWSKAIISYNEPDKKRKDLLLDEGDKYLDKVKAIDDKRDETFILAALLANARLSVDGATRWKKYGDIFEKALEQAKAINADNPRIYYLKGISVFYTPAAFGGGKKKAKEYFEKAKPLFAKQDKASILKPYWGESKNEEYLKQCGE
jgi:hypothetical protein